MRFYTGKIVQKCPFLLPIHLGKHDKFIGMIIDRSFSLAVVRHEFHYAKTEMSRCYSLAFNAFPPSKYSR